MDGVKLGLYLFYMEDINIILLQGVEKNGNKYSKQEFCDEHRRPWLGLRQFVDVNNFTLTQ